MRISDWSSDVCSSDLAMAAITGEVDCSALPLANPITLGDQAIVLGIFADTNPTPDDTGNAPVVNDVFGTDLPPLTSSRAWAIHAAAIEQYPERVEILKRTMRQTLRSEEHTSELQPLMRI